MRRIPSSVASARTWTLALAQAVALSLAAACVCPPEPEDILAIGFRTPEQAFRTFQTATRLDDPDLELRCFSVDFRRRNGISQLTWREARAELYARQPWLRAGIVGADVVDRQLDSSRARLRVDTAGGDYIVELVREDFAEIWAGDERVLDAELDWRAGVQTQAGGDGREWVVGRVQTPPDLATSSITDLRFGREWKIDEVGPLQDETDNKDEGSPPRAKTDPQLEVD